MGVMNAAKYLETIMLLRQMYAPYNVIILYKKYTQYMKYATVSLSVDSEVL
jgi:hypothetical protein